MKNKLKTLNDLKIKYKEKISLKPEDNLYEYEQGKEYAKGWIKNEAIEWIKELTKEHHNINDGEETCLERNSYDYRGCSITDDGNICEICHTLEWIKHFFNIGNDDFKGR